MRQAQAANTCCAAKNKYLIYHLLDPGPCHLRDSNVKNLWAQAESATSLFICLLLSVPGSSGCEFSLLPETLQGLPGKDILSFVFCLCERVMLPGWGWKGAALGYALFCQTLEERDALSICAGCGYLRKKMYFPWMTPRSLGSLSKQFFLWMLVAP